METVTLYRPTGPSGFRRWPARFSWQPIFYPVTNEQYAIEIARDWNVRDSGKGFVTKFQVAKSFMEQYEIHQVGTIHHTEWWIPAEDLAQLNDHIVGTIDVIHEFSA